MKYRWLGIPLFTLGLLLGGASGIACGSGYATAGCFIIFPLGAVCAMLGIYLRRIH